MRPGRGRARQPPRGRTPKRPAAPRTPPSPQLARRLGLAPAPPAPRRRLHGARDLVLAERADRPLGIQGLGAVDARVLELAQAVRAAQELRLHEVVAVRAQVLVQLVQAGLDGLHLELA